MSTHISTESTVKKLKVIMILLLAAFYFAVIAQIEIVYNILPLPIAFISSVLIIMTRQTQGHYRRISLCYAIGICVWLAANLCRLTGLYILAGSEVLLTLSSNLFLIPNCFFCLGLVFFALSEYNFLHFQRTVLNTFAIAFFSFLIVQKSLLTNWHESETVNGEVVGTVLYFFVVVFTIVLVLNIFFQTKFTGHTMETNLSAVFLVMYNLSELRMIYFRTIGRNSDNIYISAIYITGIVVYAMAQSDPSLIDRTPEPDVLNPNDRMKSRNAWINSLFAFTICTSLYMIGFFDTRDLYTALLGALAYAIVYKTIQANELSEILLMNQREENERLEEQVKEKTVELQKMNDYLIRISTTDALTGLYNRRYGMQKLQELAAQTPKRPFALYQMDLNYFKEVNDTYGHDAGDMVLKEVGQRLLNMMPEKMTAVRIGGDEFLMILEEADTTTSITDAAKVICRWMDEPIVTPCHIFEISATIGISWFPDHTDSTEKLLLFADQAMYSIKHRYDKSNYTIWDNHRGNERS